MRKTIYLTFTMLAPLLSFSQAVEKDSTAAGILTTVCDNKVFEKCENPVSYKYNKRSVEDSLATYLRKNSSPFEKGKSTFEFVVAKNSKVCEVRKLSGDMAKEDEIHIIEGLQQANDLWTVGKQNSRLICSYVRLEVKLAKNKVNVDLIKRL